VVRVNAAGDVAEPQLVERESCGVGLLELPRMPSSFLATTLYTARLTGACSAAPESESEEAISKWL
jgi:hypothetical protein